MKDIISSIIDIVQTTTDKISGFYTNYAQDISNINTKIKDNSNAISLNYFIKQIQKKYNKSGQDADFLEKNIQAFTAAIDYLSAGGTLYIPSGKYYMNYTEKLNKTNYDFCIKLEKCKNIRIVGEGNASIIKYNPLFSKQVSLLKLNKCSNIKFENLVFQGDLFKDNFDYDEFIDNDCQKAAVQKQKSLNSFFDIKNILNDKLSEQFDEANWYNANDRIQHLIKGTNCNNITFNNVTIRNSRYMGISITQSSNIIITNCRFSHILRDGCHLKHSKNTIISNNYFYRVLDDCIALHTANKDILMGWSEISKNVISNNSTMNSSIISNNHIIACQGIKILGGKNLIISNNIIKKALRHGIYIQNDLENTNYYSNIFNITIDNNIIIDTINATKGTIGRGIFLRNNINTWYYKRSSTFNKNYTPYYIANTTEPGKFGTLAKDIKISNNKIGRTCPCSGTYLNTFNQYLFDLRYEYNTLTKYENEIQKKQNINKVYFNDYNLEELSSIIFNSQMIHIEGSFFNLNIDNNDFFGSDGNSVINFYNKGNNTTYELNDIKITNNNFIDNIVLSGIILFDGLHTTGYGNVKISNNNFNLDPFFRDQKHSDDGKWVQGEAEPAINFKTNSNQNEIFNFKGYIEISDNYFDNINKIYNTPPSGLVNIKNNTLFYDGSLDKSSSLSGIGQGNNFNNLQNWNYVKVIRNNSRSYGKLRQQQ